MQVNEIIEELFGPAGTLAEDAVSIHTDEGIELNHFDELLAIDFEPFDFNTI